MSFDPSTPPSHSFFYAPVAVSAETQPYTYLPRYDEQWEDFPIRPITGLVSVLISLGHMRTNVNDSTNPRASTFLGGLTDLTGVTVLTGLAGTAGLTGLTCSVPVDTTVRAGMGPPTVRAAGMRGALGGTEYGIPTRATYALPHHSAITWRCSRILQWPVPIAASSNPREVCG